MFTKLRKIVTFDEEIHREGTRAADPVRRMIGGAVLRNSWAAQVYVADRATEIRLLSPPLGKILTERIVALAGSGAAIEAYGKAAVAGTDCEIDRASALIHTLQFGNFYREALDAKT